jgi:very-short-patch-repair endonuclease
MTRATGHTRIADGQRDLALGLDRGAAVLRGGQDLWVSSPAEQALLRLIRDARLPLPETNVKFGRFEADFAGREQRVIVQLDSPTFHTGPDVFQRDREKDLVFRDAGFDVLRFTRAHIHPRTGEGPRPPRPPRPRT